MLSLLKECEDIEITLGSSKEKAAVLRKVALMCSSGFVPQVYMRAVFSYCIGCLWVKFTPLHQAALEVLGDVLTIQSDFSNQLMDLVE